MIASALAPACLSRETRAEIRRLAGLYEHRRSALLPALFVAEEELGYLSRGALAGVAEVLEMPLAEVTSVASFYRLFALHPRGRHVVQVCTNVPCMLAGCGAVLGRLQEHLGIAPGQTTADGRFTLQTVECLAACDEAPVIIIDEDCWAVATPEDAESVLARYR